MIILANFSLCSKSSSSFGLIGRAVSKDQRIGIFIIIQSPDNLARPFGPIERLLFRMSQWYLLLRLWNGNLGFSTRSTSLTLFLKRERKSEVDQGVEFLITICFQSALSSFQRTFITLTSLF